MPAVLPQQHPANDYVREQHEMKQGKLHIGFSTPVRFGDADFSKMQILMAFLVDIHMPSCL